MGQTRLVLSGDLWSQALCAIVLGQKVPGQGEITGVPAERALFYAAVMGFESTQSRDEAGLLSRITAHASLPPEVTLAAASEIMGHFGRTPSCDLIWRRGMILSRAASARIAAQTPAPTNLRSAQRLDTVTTLSQSTPHEGFFLTRSYELQHPQYNGTQSARLTREVFVATDAALVLPYDPRRDRLLLVEQFRLGPFGRSDPYPWVLEPVAGRVDAGETPEETACRECLEEADLTLHRLEHVSSHYCSPGCSTELYHCYLGLCDLPHEGHSHGGLDSEHEDIRRHVIPFPRAMDLMQSGEINIGPLFALLLWLERERPRLRASG